MRIHRTKIDNPHPIPYNFAVPERTFYGRGILPLMAEKKLSPPLVDGDIEELRVGDKVLLSGTLYTARDAAHQRLVELTNQKKELPFDLKGQIIYYVGPTPAKPGKVIGSAGPTTAGRMDAFAPLLYSLGLKGTIGKGYRNREVREALKKYKAVYWVAVGGAAALLSRYIKKAEVIAFEDLGPEAIYKLTVENFPVIVANDGYGGDIFEEGIKHWAVKEA